MVLGFVVSLLMIFGVAMTVLVLKLRAIEEARIELIDRNRGISQQSENHLLNIGELTAALRAEKAHVEQLKRKILLMERALADLQLQLRRG